MVREHREVEPNVDNLYTQRVFLRFLWQSI